MPQAQESRLLAEKARGDAEKLVGFLIEDFYDELAPTGRLETMGKLAHDGGRLLRRPAGRAHDAADAGVSRHGAHPGGWRTARRQGHQGRHREHRAGPRAVRKAPVPRQHQRASDLRSGAVPDGALLRLGPERRARVETERPAGGDGPAQASRLCTRRVAAGADHLCRHSQLPESLEGQQGGRHRRVRGGTQDPRRARRARPLRPERHLRLCRHHRLAGPSHDVPRPV